MKNRSRVKTSTEMTRLMLIILMLCVPAPASAFVPHEYPAIYTHQLGGIFYLVSLTVVLWGILRNRLHREAGWRYFFVSVVLFIIWDSVIVLGRFAEAMFLEPSQTVGGKDGLSYFARRISIEGLEYLYYLGRFDFIILNIAMLFFYLGLREHLAKEERLSRGVAPALLPLLPVIVTDMVGSVVFIVLSTMSLATSVKLFRRERDNPLWNYMVWLSASYVLFAFSRSFGHVLRHILVPLGYENVWSYMDGVTGSLNTSVRFLVASLTLFFIWTYKIYLKMSREERELEMVNLDLTELNQELETLVAERTMALMGLTVADRVRNPAALIGCACKRIVDKEKKLGQDLIDVIGECKKLEGIVGDFEDLLKSRRSMFKYDDINGIVRNVLSVVQKEISGKKIRLSDNLSEGPLRMNMQRNLVRAALYHVVRNAIDATPEGGAIYVSTSQDQDLITVAVSDTGAGIPSEDIERVFDPFFTTKKMRFGMGLPLVKQIVSEHLGEIKVESEVGKGTTFRLIFPVRWMEKKSNQLTT
ncbi:MAG: sensor histidine kinase [Chloroflexota bacterium]